MKSERNVLWICTVLVKRECQTAGGQGRDEVRDVNIKLEEKGKRKKDKG